MELSYNANMWMLEISDTETTNANYADKGDFKFTYSWYRSFYLYFWQGSFLIRKSFVLREQN